MNIFTKKSLVERSKEVLSSFTSIVNELNKINEELDTQITDNKESINKLTLENVDLTNQSTTNSKIIENITKILN